MNVAIWILGALLVLNSGYCLWRMAGVRASMEAWAQKNGMSKSDLPRSPSIVPLVHTIIFLLGVALIASRLF